MVVYIIGFIISILLLFYAETKKFTGKGIRLVTFIAILIPCLIAGLRDKTIGTDVTVYVENMFLIAESSESFAEYLGSEYSAYGWDFRSISSLEIGFTLLVFVMQRVFNSLPLLLFTIQAMTVVPIYKGLRKVDSPDAVWLGMTVYYLMFFNQTLNLMRQWIAMGILFYAFHFLMKKEYLKYLISIGVASLFHLSAIMGFVILVIYRLVVEENSLKRSTKAIFVILIGVVALFSLDYIVRLFELLGLHYGNYINGDLQLMSNQFIYRLPLILLFITRWRHWRIKYPFGEFYVVMLAYDLLASQLTSIYPHSGRLGTYFREYYMLAYPMVCSATSIKNNRRILIFFIIAFLCVYWWYVYVFGGSDETIPYVSIWG